MPALDRAVDHDGRKGKGFLCPTGGAESRQLVLVTQLLERGELHLESAHGFEGLLWICELLDGLQRGANSLQLVHDRGRWWILSVMWERESPLHPLPAELLGAARG